MIHYHGGEITPYDAMYQLAGKHFCCSYGRAGKSPQTVGIAHQIGQSVMLDNGAWSFYNSGRPVDWLQFIAWATPWLQYPTTWAVVPDVIGGTPQENDDLLVWFLRRAKALRPWQLAPVWHVGQPAERLQRLASNHQRVCIGSGQYTPGTDQWRRLVDPAMDALCGQDGAVPCWLHMLRGFAMIGQEYPLASVDSSTLARSFKGDNKGNHVQGLRRRADELDGVQCPARWRSRGEQLPFDYDVPTPIDHTARRRGLGQRLFEEESA